MSEACLTYLVGMNDEWVAFARGTGGVGGGADPSRRRPCNDEAEMDAERERIEAEEDIIG